MPAPDDRLQELRRQRALVQQQLTFLDREIAAASGQAEPAGQIPQPVPAAHLQPATSPAESDAVAAIIKSLEADSRLNPDKVKSGCIRIFVAGLVLFILCLVAYGYYLSRHPSPPVQ
jgi:hypothetical protein